MRQSGTAVEGARDAAHLRRLNLERVLAAALAQDEPFTRAKLIEITGLSAPTVGSLTASLIRSGLVTDLGTGPSRGGRRPSRMEFNALHGFSAAIDLGPTLTRLGLADLRGKLHARRTVPTPRETSPGAMLSVLADEVRTLMREANVPSARLLAVAAGAPGVVDPRRGMVVALANNLNGWSDVPMAAILRDALGVPVIVENDVNLAVLGEHWKGAARGHDTCAFLKFGTGVGAGIMVNGHLHHGQNFLAGEIGLMCMGPQYVETDFGSRGCLETLAGLGALKVRWPESDADSPDWVAELFRAATAGDPKARQIVQDAGTILGIATANICSMLDPSIVVLGGALIGQGELLVGTVRRVVQRVIPSPPPIVVSSLDKEAPLWGSLLLSTNEARARVRQQLGKHAARHTHERAHDVSG